METSNLTWLRLYRVRYPPLWNPSAHAVLNAPIYASSHDVHVRPFTTGKIHNLLKK